MPGTFSAVRKNPVKSWAALTVHQASNSHHPAAAMPRDWQIVLSVVGVFIAVLALYAAITESEAVRRQTAAAVWPFVQVSIADYDSGDAGWRTASHRPWIQSQRMRAQALATGISQPDATGRRTPPNQSFWRTLQPSTSYAPALRRSATPEETQ